MPALATAPAAAPAAPRRARGARPPAARVAARPGGPTLERLVLLASAALDAGAPAECPVCGGMMLRESGCDGCGSRIE